MGSRPIVQVKVDDGQQVPADIDLSVQETFFADLVGPERDILPGDNGMT